MSFTPLTQRQLDGDSGSLTAGFKPLSSFEDARSNLQQSQAVSDSVIRKSMQAALPLEGIAAGEQANPLEVMKGTMKQAGHELSTAGAQNAGPIGQGMLAASENKLNPNAPSWKEATGMLDTATKPTNIEQGVGAGYVEAGKFLPVPTGAVETPGVFSKVGNWLRTKLGTRTLEDVKNTPEAMVSKLNPVERKAYFDNQKLGIEQKYTQMEEQLAKAASDKQVALKTEADSLLKQAQTASRDETISLRPKVIKAMGEQSKEYRRLIENQISDIKDSPVSRTDLQQFLSSRYADSPEYGQAISQKLGMAEPGSETTIGKIYERMTSLGKDIAASAKKGSRTYTPDEKMTDDAINTLTDFMKERGVDFTEARKFWAQYAPVRNQMVNTIRPFNQAGTETGGFAKMLTKVSQGKDVNNENFIKSVTDLIGEDIGTETKSALSKLDANQKAQIASEIEKAVQQDTIQMSKNTELTKLDERMYEAERAARTRKIIKTILIGATAYKANQYMKERTGVGI